MVISCMLCGLRYNFVQLIMCVKSAFIQTRRITASPRYATFPLIYKKAHTPFLGKLPILLQYSCKNVLSDK